MPGTAVSLTWCRRSSWAGGRGTGTGSSHVSSRVRRRVRSSDNAPNMSSTSPSGKIPRRTSQLRLRPPSCSIAWQSIHTWGVWVIPLTSVPLGPSADGAPASSPVSPIVLV